MRKSCKLWWTQEPEDFTMEVKTTYLSHLNKYEIEDVTEMRIQTSVAPKMPEKEKTMIFGWTYPKFRVAIVGNLNSMQHEYLNQQVNQELIEQMLKQKEKDMLLYCTEDFVAIIATRNKTASEMFEIASFLAEATMTVENSRRNGKKVILKR